MWQVALAAAVAGSGLLAKRIFTPSNSLSPSSSSSTNTLLQQQQQQQQTPCNPLNSLAEFIGDGVQTDEVFHFSSSPSKKHSTLVNKIKAAPKNKNKPTNKNKINKKKVTLSLKRRKISTSLPLSKDCSSFGWGVGLGMICMMSAGKAEISKLSCTIDETAKIVNELKSELNKQKSVPCHQNLSFSDSENAVDTIQKPVAVLANNESCLLSKHPIDTKLFSHLADSDYASSVLTEEHQYEGAEMAQLEAELESELRKLPWCATEISKHGVSNQMERQGVNQNSASCHSDGVNAAELGNKLSNLLIEQQESQISELESELNSAYSKLQEKEAELQKLKECVKRLTEFSLSTVSDEETEVLQEEPGEFDRNILVLADNATVGTKRAMHFS